MALYPRLPNPSYPSGRYTRTNPLRREFGLRLLTESLLSRCAPASSAPGVGLPTSMAKKPSRTCTASAPPKPAYPSVNPRLLGLITLAELEVSRRVVEAPLASISRVTRNKLLASQGAYLNALYAALAIQLGSAEAACAEFLRLLLSVV